MQLDGSLADMATMTVAAACAFATPIKRWKSKKAPAFVRERIIVDLLNGATVVPFVLMIGSVFSSEILKELMASAKITLALGGAVGLVFVLGELFRNDTPP